MITPGGKSLYARQSRDKFVIRMVTSSAGTSRAMVAKAPAIIMLRASVIRDSEKGGLGVSGRDAYVFLNWSGYRDSQNPKTGRARAETSGARTLRLQTSGHASAPALSAFAMAMAPAAVIPVHGTQWDVPGILLQPVQRLTAGQPWLVP